VKAGQVGAEVMAAVPDQGHPIHAKEITRAADKCRRRLVDEEDDTMERKQRISEGCKRGVSRALMFLVLLAPAACRDGQREHGHAQSDPCGCDSPGGAPQALTVAEQAALEKVKLRGVVDLHIHTAPDNVPRLIDDLEMARLARKNKMRAIVLKSHVFQTAARAELATRVVPGIEVFGGISLNRSAGGLNFQAVREMTLLEGKRGKIVWLPTRDTAFVPVVANGQVVPELAALFPLIAQNDLVLATGHTNPANTLVVLDAAKAAGVTKLLVTHPLSASVNASLADLQAMAARGALLELVYLATVGAPEVFQRYADAIAAIGAEHFVISSDLGQPTNLSPTDGMRDMIAKLRVLGVTDAQLDWMVRRNPARLLGLPEDAGASGVAEED
jgi:hypothetical protein